MEEARCNGSASRSKQSESAPTQRRVFSEQLGVAFAIAAGERWHAIAHGGSVNVVSIDIDNLVDVPGYRSWGIKHLAGKRTDFLQLSPTGNGTWWRASVLETKAQKNRTRATTS